MQSAPPKTDSLADVAARLSRLEGIVEQLNQRLTNLKARVDSGFRWMIGIQVTTLLTLGTLILVKLG
ncbi:MAG: hypothetical protein OXU79_08565 [Gemmatimonadota bacterium]|nr:hypothetical protein [Gemmatimonadota bacterium]